jgi:hypothetical protein
MSSPRDPDCDLRLERSGDRDGRRPARLGAVAQVTSPVVGANRAEEFQAAYQGAYRRQVHRAGGGRTLTLASKGQRKRLSAPAG